jgi:hypothetical protein
MYKPLPRLPSSLHNLWPSCNRQNARLCLCSPPELTTLDRWVELTRNTNRAGKLGHIMSPAANAHGEHEMINDECAWL